MSDETSISDDILSTVKIDMPDFETAVKVVQPSAMREGFATVPNVTW
jgi:ribosome biogenesis ATPase